MSGKRFAVMASTDFMIITQQMGSVLKVDWRLVDMELYIWRMYLVVMEISLLMSVDKRLQSTRNWRRLRGSLLRIESSSSRVISMQRCEL